MLTVILNKCVYLWKRLNFLILYFCFQIITYHSETPAHSVKDEDTILCGKRFEGVEANSTKTFNNVFSLPVERALNFDNCRLLEVSHQVKAS